MLCNFFESHPCIVAGGDGLEGILIQQLQEGPLDISLVDVGPTQSQICGELEDTALDHVAGHAAVDLGATSIQENFPIYWREGSVPKDSIPRRCRSRGDTCCDLRRGIGFSLSPLLVRGDLVDRILGPGALSVEAEERAGGTACVAALGATNDCPERELQRNLCNWLDRNGRLLNVSGQHGGCAGAGAALGAAAKAPCPIHRVHGVDRVVAVPAVICCPPRRRYIRTLTALPLRGMPIVTRRRSWWTAGA